jgi:hypothetical protein
MTNTGGMTWDMGVIPFVPVPYQWQKRYDKMIEYSENFGLCGIMESHHYGFYPSFVSELSNEVFRDSERTMDEMLDDVLTAEFGKEHIDAIKKALRCMSDSNACYTRSSGDGCSTLRIGAAWPLCVKLGLRPPTVSFAHFGNRIVAARFDTEKGWQMQHRLFGEELPDEVISWEKALEYARKGVEILESIENPNENLERLILLCKYIVCQCVSSINIKKWYLKKMELDHSKKDRALELVSEMREIMREEIKNAEAAIECTDYDSRLGWEPSMEYIADSDHLRWKIAQVKYVMENELEEYVKVANNED